LLLRVTKVVVAEKQYQIAECQFPISKIH
jgi:hypothetical protein